jgi:glycosyltransferase involved in cell wall biosynthesis
VLTAHRALGGGARHARSLARGLRELGVRVSLLCTGAQSADGDADYDEIIACQPHSWPLLWRFQPFGSLPFWYRTVRKAATHVDAVIALSAPLALATRWAVPRMPLLYAPAMLYRLEYPQWRCSAYAWFERQAFRCADGVLVHTQAVQEAIETFYGPLRRPTGVCLSGIDDGHASATGRTRSDLGVPPDAKLLVTAGLMNENKGQRYIARALARSAEPNWWWAIVGEGGDGPAIRAELQGSSMESRTLFVGIDRHIGDWYAAAHLYVGASRTETFGQAVAESLRAGLPVVIPQNTFGDTLSPLAEVVERYRLGYTFKRRDTASLSNALRTALGDEGELRAAGQRAAAFAHANFTCARYAECAVRLLESSSDVIYEVSPPAPGERSDIGDTPRPQPDHVLTAAR